MPSTVLGTRKTVLNKINNRVYVLVGMKETSREEKREQVKHIDGGMW